MAGGPFGHNNGMGCGCGRHDDDKGCVGLIEVLRMRAATGLGEISREEVEELATELGLPVKQFSDRSESAK